MLSYKLLLLFLKSKTVLLNLFMCKCFFWMFLFLLWTYLSAFEIVLCASDFSFIIFNKYLFLSRNFSISFALKKRLFFLLLLIWSDFSNFPWSSFEFSILFIILFIWVFILIGLALCLFKCLFLSRKKTKSFFSWLIFSSNSFEYSLFIIMLSYI